MLFELDRRLKEESPRNAKGRIEISELRTFCMHSVDPYEEWRSRFPRAGASGDAKLSQGTNMLIALYTYRWGELIHKCASLYYRVELYSSRGSYGYNEVAAYRAFTWASIGLSVVYASHDPPGVLIMGIPLHSHHMEFTIEQKNPCRAHILALRRLRVSVRESDLGFQYRYYDTNNICRH